MPATQTPPIICLLLMFNNPPPPCPVHLLKYPPTLLKRKTVDCTSNKFEKINIMTPQKFTNLKIYICYIGSVYTL